jgi:hypothetical protein
MKYKCPYLDAASVSGALFRNYGATNMAATQKDKPPLLPKSGPQFQTHKRSWNEHKLVMGPDGARN